jgi:CRP-like cAMP-binding protein
VSVARALSYSSWISVEAGDFIFQRGDMDSNIYFISTGEMQEVDDLGVEVRVLKTGEYFGHVEFVGDSQLRSANIRASYTHLSTDLVSIDRAHLVLLAEKHAKFRNQHLFKVLVQNPLEMQERKMARQRSTSRKIKNLRHPSNSSTHSPSAQVGDRKHSSSFSLDFSRDTSAKGNNSRGSGAGPSLRVRRSRSGLGTRPSLTMGSIPDLGRFKDVLISADETSEDE